jgi:hypothetical protein
MIVQQEWIVCVGDRRLRCTRPPCGMMQQVQVRVATAAHHRRFGKGCSEASVSAWGPTSADDGIGAANGVGFCH